MIENIFLICVFVVFFVSKRVFLVCNICLILFIMLEKVILKEKLNVFLG